MNNEISKFRDFRYPVELRRRDTGITISYHQQKRGFPAEWPVNYDSKLFRFVHEFQIPHHSKSLWTFKLNCFEKNFENFKSQVTFWLSYAPNVFLLKILIFGTLKSSRTLIKRLSHVVKSCTCIAFDSFLILLIPKVIRNDVFRKNTCILKYIILRYKSSRYQFQGEITIRW